MGFKVVKCLDITLDPRVVTWKMLSKLWRSWDVSNMQQVDAAHPHVSFRGTLKGHI